MQKRNSERGMSLVEATIILMVLATLTAVIAPSMGDFLEDARAHKVKEDTESLGIAIVRMLKDTGLKGLKLDATTGFTEVNRVDVLISASGTASSNSGTSYASGELNGGTADWDQTDNDDTFENQLVKNFPGGTTDGSTSYTLPTEGNRGRGWRGSYLNAVPGADPWGYKYYANVAFLVTATDSTAGTGEGQVSGFWARDVVVLSPGPDNIIQSTFGGSAGGGFGAAAANDDVAFVVQGNTR
jgi:type II secretory pathway pseudopilin PulG